MLSLSPPFVFPQCRLEEHPISHVACCLHSYVQPSDLLKDQRKCPCRMYLFAFIPDIGRELPVATDLSHTTTYLPVISRGVAPFALRLKVPISRAAEDPKGLTSPIVSFGSATSSAILFHITSIAALPFTMCEPGGKALASSV